MAVKSKAGSGDIQSIQRALDVVEAVADSGELGVSELARRLDLRVSTVHSILRTLTRRFYLLNDNGRYRLGPGLTVVTSRWDPALSLPSLIGPTLRRISESTGHAATATALVGAEACLLGFRSAAGPVTVTPEPWSRRDPLALATGRVLVALTRPSEWDEFIAAGYEAEPDWSSDRWRRELSHIAETAVCTKDATDPAGHLGVAVPVWSTQQSVICAIGTSAPAFLGSHTFTEEMLKVLWPATAELSANLGCPTLPGDAPT